MKRILILSACSPQKGSGVEKIAFEIGKKLSKNYEVIFLYSSYKKENYILENINYIGISTPKIPLFNFFIQSFKTYFFILNKKIDLIIDNQAISWLFLILLRYKLSIKILGIAHGTCMSFIKYVKFKNIFQKILYYITFRPMSIFEKIYFRKSDILIINSTYVENEIRKFYGNYKYNFYTIYNGYDNLNHHIKSSNKNDPLKVVFVSNAHLVKGIDILEGVAEKLKLENIVFNIIGEKYIKKGFNNINYIGKLSRNEVYNNMLSNDIVFLPSYREGQPLVIIEAMSLGCIPVISGECHMDMLENTEFKEFISYENKIEDYVKIFTKLLENREDLLEYKKKAQNFVKPYSRENQTNKYKDVVDSLLK